MAVDYPLNPDGQVYLNRLSDRAVKSRFNVLLFSLILIVYQYSDATITQLAFLKFESTSKVSQVLIDTVLMIVTSYHLLMFGTLVKEEHAKGVGSNQLQQFKNLSMNINQISDNMGRASQADTSLWNDFNEKYKEEEIALKKRLEASRTRFWAVDILLPISVYVTAIVGCFIG